MRKSIFTLLLATSIVLCAGMAKADLQIMKSRFDVSFYGYIKAEAISHSARAFGVNYILFALPDIAPYDQQHTLAFEVRQSRFGFNIASPGPSEASKVLGNIEMDFFGTGFTENKAAPMLRRATVTLKYPKWSLMAGQDWMLVSPLYPHTSNYPAGSGMGNIGHRMPQFRLTVGDQLRGAISVGRKIEGDLSTSDFDAGSVSTVPDTQIQLGYFSKKGLVFALSGHYAEEMYTFGPLAPGNHYFYQTMESWSTNLSVNLPIGKRLALSGEAYYGANLDGWYTGNIFAQGVGIQANGTRVPVHDMGGWVELMVKPIKKVTIFIGFGEDDPLNEDLSKGPYPAFASTLGLTGFTAMTLNQMYFGHFFYEITEAMKVSLEVMQVRTEYHNQQPHRDGTVMCYDLAFWYYF